MLLIIIIIVIILFYLLRKEGFTDTIPEKNNVKILHQIWFQGLEEVPDNYKKNIINNKKICQDWKYFFWDEKKIDKLFKRIDNENWFNKYKNYKHLHQKIDFAKYVILYYYGGFYVDMDAKIIKNPNILFKIFPFHDIYLSYNIGTRLEHYMIVGVNKAINNGVIIVRNKKNMIMKQLIDALTNAKSKSLTKFSQIQNSTGPKIFTIVINKLNIKYPNNIKILPNEYFEPCLGDNCKITENTITIHKHDVSWLNNNYKKIYKLYSKYRI